MIVGFYDVSKNLLYTTQILCFLGYIILPNFPKCQRRFLKRKKAIWMHEPNIRQLQSSEFSHGVISKNCCIQLHCTFVSVYWVTSWGRSNSVRFTFGFLEKLSEVSTPLSHTRERTAPRNDTFFDFCTLYSVKGQNLVLSIFSIHWVKKAWFLIYCTFFTDQFRIY